MPEWLSELPVGTIGFLITFVIVGIGLAIAKILEKAEKDKDG
jgi:F0F1-type ATP synthase assembly protein I